MPNPRFAGSYDVNGADADFVVGDELVELKTTKTLDGRALREALTQLVGYCLLDYADALEIRTVGVYFPRHQLLRSWPLWAIVSPPEFVFDGSSMPSSSEFIERLSDLRAAMREAAARPSPGRFPVVRRHRR